MADHDLKHYVAKATASGTRESPWWRNLPAEDQKEIGKLCAGLFRVDGDMPAGTFMAVFPMKAKNG